MSSEALFPFPAKLQPYAEAIGAVCLDWANLEGMVSTLFQSLSGIKGKRQFETISHNIDFREKLQIVLGLAYLKRRDKKYFGILKWCVDQIDGVLRPQRNRYVHDLWFLTPPSGTLTEADGRGGVRVERIQFKTGFRKPRPFKIRYYTRLRGKETPKDIMDLGIEIHHMTIRLNILMYAFEGSMESDDEPQELLQKLVPLPPPVAERFGLPPADAWRVRAHRQRSSRMKSRG